MTASMARPRLAERPRIFGSYVWISLVLLAISVLGTTENSTVSLAGRGLFYAVALSFVPIFAYFLAAKLVVPKISASILLMMAALAAMYAIYAIAGSSVVAVTFFIQFLVVFSSFVVFMQAGMTGSDSGFRTVAIISTSILVAYTGALLLNPGLALGSGWAGGLSNQNLFGMFVFMMLGLIGVMVTLRGRLSFPWIIALALMSALLIYASKSRSSLVALALSYVTFFAWPFMSRRRGLYTAFFLGVIAFVWYATYSGANRIFLTDWLDQAQLSLGREYGKNTDSGRAALWNIALEYIAQKPLFGWGIRDHASTALNTGLSFHNWYLTIAYHFGIFGLSAYVVLLFLVWSVLCNSGHRLYARIAASAMIGMMMTQVFEVSLTQNNLNIGIVYWAFLGLVVGRLARDGATSASVRNNTRLPVQPA